MKNKKTVLTIVRYWRVPTPSCNWCPRYCSVYNGKNLIEERLDDRSIIFDESGDASVFSFNSAENIIHDLRKHKEWEEINDLGEVEISIREFNNLKKRFSSRWKSCNVGVLK